MLENDGPSNAESLVVCCCAGLMHVSCPLMPDPITIALPRDTLPDKPTASLSQKASVQPDKAPALPNGRSAQDTHRLARSLPSSLQPTPVKAPKHAKIGSNPPLAPISAHNSDADSAAGSIVSQSGMASLSRSLAPVRLGYMQSTI